MAGVPSYGGDRRAQAQFREWAVTGPDHQRFLGSMLMILVLLGVLYTSGSLQNPGCSVIVELDETSERGLRQLRQTLECLYDSLRISPTRVEVIILCACSEPDLTLLKPLYYHAAMEAGGQPHAPYFPLTFMWDQPLAYQSVIADVAQFKFVAFLPSDVCVEPMWAFNSLYHLLWGGTEVLGSRVIAADGTVEHGGVEYQWAPVAMGREALQPAFFLRGYPGSDPRVMEDRTVASVSKVGLMVSRVWFVMNFGFNETLAPHYDALAFSLMTRAGGGRVRFCASCVVRRLPGSDGRWAEEHNARDPPTSQSTAFLKDWAPVLEHITRHQWRSDWGITIAASVSPSEGATQEAVTLLMGLQKEHHVAFRPMTDAPMPPSISSLRFPDWTEETLQRAADRRPHGKARALQIDYFTNGETEPSSDGPTAVPRILRASFDSNASAWALKQAVSPSTHEVWVPSALHAFQLHTLGLSATSVQVVPPMVDTDFWSPGELTPKEARAVLRAPWRNWTAFSFLTVLQWSSSSGLEELVRAFVAEFHCCPTQRCADLALILKIKVDGAEDSDTAEADPHPQIAVREAVTRALPAGCTAPRIDVWTTFLSLHRLRLLYRSVNAYVSPARSVAWGLSTLQAMAMGLPTIGAPVGAASGFLHSNISLPLACPMLDGGLRCVAIEVGDLRRALATAFANPGTITLLGLSAHLHTRAYHSVPAVLPLIQKRLRDLFVEVAGVQPRSLDHLRAPQSD